MKRCLASFVAVCLLAVAPGAARRYTASRDGDVIVLGDSATATIVSIMPSVGNIAFDMQVKGHRVLRFAQGSPAAFKTSPNTTGIPFMARGSTGSTSRPSMPTGGATRSTWSSETSAARFRFTDF